MHVIALLLVFLSPIQDQDTLNQRLAVEIEETVDPWDKFEKLITACEDLMYEDNHLVIKYGLMARDIARDLEFKEGEVRALSRVAGAYMRENDYSRAEELINQAIDIAEATGHADSRFYSYWFKADLDYKSGNYEEALEGYAKALEVLPDTTIVPSAKPINVAIAYANMGEIYLALGQTEKSIEYSKASVDATVDFTGYSHRIILIIQLINAYMGNGEYENAIEYAQLALSIAREHELEASENRPLLLLAQAYLEKYNESQESDFLNKAEKYFQQVRRDQLSPDFQMLYLLVQGKLDFHLGDFLSAEKALTSAIELNNEHPDPLILIKCHLVLAEVLKNTRRYEEGYQHLKTAVETERKLYRDNFSQTIARMQVRHDSIRNENQLSEEKLKNQILEQKAQTTLLIIYALAVLAVLVLIVAYLSYRKYCDKKLTAKKMEELSRIDHLTGLLNRRAMSEEIENENVRFQRNERPFSVILADVDNLTQFNDLHGHACGDNVLRFVAEILNSSVRGQDKVARWGGEEFLLLLPETDGESARVLAEKLRGLVSEKPLLWDGVELSVTLSLGVSQYAPESGADNAVIQADHALLHAKQTGRNKVGQIR